MKRSASSSYGSSSSRRAANDGWSEYTKGKERPVNVSTATAKRGASFSATVIETNVFRNGSKIGRPVLSVSRKHKAAGFTLKVDLTRTELVSDDPNVRWIAPDTIEFSPIQWKVNKDCNKDTDVTRAADVAEPLVRRIKHGDLIDLRTQYHSDFPINVAADVQMNGVHYTPELGVKIETNGNKLITRRVFTNCTDMGPDTTKSSLETGVRGAATDGVNFFYHLFVTSPTPVLTPWDPDIPFNNSYRTIIMPWFVTPLYDVNTNNPGFSAVIKSKWGKGDGKNGEFEDSYEKKETREHNFYSILHVQSDGIVRYPQIVQDPETNKWIVKRGEDIDFSIKAQVSESVLAMLGPNEKDYQKDLVSWLLEQLRVIFIVKQDTQDTEGLSYNREDYQKSGRFGLAGNAHFMYTNLVESIPILGLQINRSLVMDLLNPKKKPVNAQWRCGIENLKDLLETVNNDSHHIDYEDFIYLNESNNIPEEDHDFYLLVEPIVLDQIINALLVACPKAIKVVPIEEEYLKRGCSSFEPLLVLEGKEDEYLAALRKILFSLTNKTIYHLYAIPESEPSPLSKLVVQPVMLDKYMADFDILIHNYMEYQKRAKNNAITSYMVPVDKTTSSSSNGEELRRNFLNSETQN